MTDDRLAAALGAMGRDDAGPDERRDLYRALLGSELVVPVQGQPDDDATTVQVTVLEDELGRVAIPVFSGEGPLSAWMTEGTAAIRMQGRDLFAMLASDLPDVVLIDPAGPAGGQLSREVVRSLGRGELPDVDEVGSADPDEHDAHDRKDEHVRVGAPSDSEVPDGLSALLRDQVEIHREVDAAYLLMVGIGRREPNLAIAVDVGDDADGIVVAAVFGSIGEAVRPAVPEDAIIDLLPVTPALRARLADAGIAPVGG